MYLLGCDIGCSSVKVSIVDAETGLPVGTKKKLLLLHKDQDGPNRIRKIGGFM